MFLENHPELKEQSAADTYADAQYELGRLLFEAGRYRDAICHLEGALALAKGDNRKMICYRLGRCHFENEDWGAAEKRLTESLPEDPRDPWWRHTQYCLGLCHL